MEKSDADIKSEKHTAYRTAYRTDSDKPNAQVLRDVYYAIKDWGQPEGCTTADLVGLFDNVHKRNVVTRALSTLIYATNSPVSAERSQMTNARGGTWKNIVANAPLPVRLVMPYTPVSGKTRVHRKHTVESQISECDDVAVLMQWQKLIVDRRRALQFPQSTQPDSRNQPDPKANGADRAPTF